MVVRGRLAYDDSGRLVEIDPNATDPNNPTASEIQPVEFEDAVTHLLRFADSTADPTAAGEMRLNGTDVKVYSGGAVQNLSDIIAESAISHDGIDQTTVDPADHHAKYTDEEAQDAVGTILGPLFTYDDVTPVITLDEGEISHDAIDQTTVTANDHHAQDHDNADHTTNMIEDATTTGNAPYEVQKNGTDGTGIINFKTQ